MYFPEKQSELIVHSTPFVLRSGRKEKKNRLDPL